MPVFKYMLGSNQNPPSSNMNSDWMYATKGNETRIKIIRRNFILKMRREGRELIFEQHSKSGIKETRLTLTEKSLDWAAREFDYTSGKWLVFRHRDEIDEVWTKIASSTINGELGSSAKVSTALQEEMRHVICIYTEDYFDNDDIMRVRTKLRELGIEETLYYKPDIYTRLNIYSGNKAVRPWRYSD
jgi:hypothetical protein